MEPTGPAEKHAEYVFSVSELKRMIEVAKGAENIAIRVMIQPMERKTFFLEVFAIPEDASGKEIECSYTTEKKSAKSKRTAGKEAVSTITMAATSAAAVAVRVKGCPRPPSC